MKFVAKTSRVREFTSKFIIFGVIVQAVRGTLDFAEKEKSTIIIKLINSGKPEYMTRRTLPEEKKLNPAPS